MKVRIEHCAVCWGYRDRALLLAEQLQKRFGATVEVVKGALGQFDVRVEGKLISSRGDTLLARATPPGLPDLADIVAAIERREPVVRKRFGSEDAKRFYDRIGSWQDTQFYERAALAYLVAHSDFEHSSAVFEWGCGTGRLAECLFKTHLGDTASYVGIDISSTMVRLAAQRLTPWMDRATIRQADGTAKLAVADAAFDRFVATYVFDLLPEGAIRDVLSEARRILRPDGKLCVVTSTDGATPLSRIVGSVWNGLYALSPNLVGGCRPLRISASLDESAWKTEHTHVVCSWGICSEIVIASPAVIQIP